MANDTQRVVVMGGEELSAPSVKKELRKRPSRIVRITAEEEEEKVKEEEDNKDEGTVATSTSTSTETRYELYRLKAEPLFLAGLEMSFYIANYQFMALITMLTSKWGFSLVAAVIITNVQEAAKALLVIIFAWLGDTYLGDCMLVLLSAYIYSIGMALWYLMYPTYVRSLYYLGLVLITAGQSGYDKYDTQCEKVENNKNVHKHKVANNLENDETKQEQEQEKQENGDMICRLETSSFLMRIKTSKTCRDFMIFVNNRSTRINFVGIALSKLLTMSGLLPPICILLAYSAIFFAGKLFLYPFAKPEGSPLSPILKPSLLSVKNRLFEMWRHLFDNCKHDPNDVENPERAQTVLTIDQQLGCVDATLSHNKENDYINQEDTKRFVAYVRLSLWFLMYGVMTAMSNTFIVEQANAMNLYIGTFEVPIQWFVLSSNGVKSLVSYLCNRKWGEELEESHARFFYAGTRRVGFGMLLSILWFAIASIIEAKRLKAVKGDMCVLWLTPLLILLGVMDGLAMSGVECFFEKEIPSKVAKPYGGILAEGIIGMGKLFSVVWFCFWSKTTGWFGKDIDTSHLDYFYNRVMVGFSCACVLVYYAWIAYTYIRRKLQIEYQSVVEVVSSLLLYPWADPTWI